MLFISCFFLCPLKFKLFEWFGSWRSIVLIEYCFLNLNLILRSDEWAHLIIIKNYFVVIVWLWEIWSYFDFFFHQDCLNRFCHFINFVLSLQKVIIVRDEFSFVSDVCLFWQSLINFWFYNFWSFFCFWDWVSSSLLRGILLIIWL